MLDLADKNFKEVIIMFSWVHAYSPSYSEAEGLLKPASLMPVWATQEDPALKQQQK